MKYALVFCFLTGVFAHAQPDYVLTGTIVDGQQNMLSGAAVYIPELNKGTISDSAGHFVMMDLPSGIFTFEVSFLGHETAILLIDTDHPPEQLKIILPSNPIEGKAVVISGGSYSSQHENAIKIDAIQNRDLKGLGKPTLVEGLSESPGIDLVNYGGAAITPVIRGLSTSNILFLNNGIRLENYQFSGEHPYLTDAFGISQVELIRGPASLLYGSDAIGGVVNSIPEYPAASGAIDGDVLAQYYSNTSGYAGSAGIKGSDSKFSWGARGSLNSHADYISGDGTRVPNTRFKGYSFKSFSMYRTSRAIFKLYYDYNKLKAGMANEESVLLVPDNSHNNEVWYQDLDNHMVISKNTIFFNHNRIMLNMAYQENLRKLIGNPAEEEHPLVNMRLRTVNYELKDLITPGENLTYTLALQGMFQQNANEMGESRVLPDFTVQDIGLFGMVQLRLQDRLHLQGGIRMDNRWLIVPGQPATSHSHSGEPDEENPGNEILQAFNRYYGNVSVSAGITFELNDKLLFRTNLASAFRAPNIAELTQDGEHGLRYEQGDRNLSPQRNYESDVSIHYHSPFLMVDIAGFYNGIRNYIYLGITSDTSSEGNTIYRYQQSDAFLTGSEISFEIHPWKHIHAGGNYAFLVGRRKDGSPLPLIPQNKLNLDLGFEKKASFWIQEYSLQIGWLCAFSKKDAGENEWSADAYTLIRISAGLRISFSGQPLEINFVLNNLTNRQYTDQLSMLNELGYSDMGRSANISIQIPFGFKQPG